jgi:hypothetical protein
MNVAILGVMLLAAAAQHVDRHGIEGKTLKVQYNANAVCRG